MPLREEELFKELMERILFNSVVCRHMSSRNLNDRAVFSETLYEKIGSILFQCRLVNTNTVTANFPIVDLVDVNARIAAQVTVNDDRSKIDETLGKFLSNRLYETFNTLYFFIIGGAPKYRRPFNTEKKFIFDASKHIIDDARLFTMTRTLGTDILEAIVLVTREHIQFPINVQNLSLPRRERIAALWSSIWSLRIIVKDSVVPDFEGRDQLRPELASSLSRSFMKDLRQGLAGLSGELSDGTIALAELFLKQFDCSLKAIEAFSAASVPGQMRDFKTWAIADNRQKKLSITTAALEGALLNETRGYR